MILYKDYICLDTCKHMKDICWTPGNSLDVLSTQKYPQYDSSGNLFKSYAYFLIHSFFWSPLSDNQNRKGKICVR